MNSKNSHIREMVLDRCLRSKQNYCMLDLMEAVNRELESRGLRPITQKHTIFADMRNIANRHHINIQEEKVGVKVYYRYEDPNFSMFKNPLSDEEMINLTTTMSMLKRFQGIPNFEWLQKMIENCESKLNTKLVDAAFISLEENPYAAGLDFLTPIYESIVNKKVIEVTYRPFTSSESFVVTIHPYYLKQYNTRWFLFGHRNDLDVLTNLAVDRIEQIVETKERYIENTKYDFVDYFEDIVGVSREPEDEVQRVLIWISAKQWPYVRSKPFHNSQRVAERREDGSVVIEIKVILNWELEHQILAQGEHMTVLHPESLRDKIKKRAELLLKNYNS